MLTGGCQCGAIRFQVLGPTGRLFICHCDHCRRLTGSAFDVALECGARQIALLQGSPRHSLRIADSGNRVTIAFCGACGCHLWEGDDSLGATVKVGVLDQRIDLSDVVHLYVARRLPGIVIPENAVQYPGEPD